MRILFVISLIILSGCTGTKNLTNSSTPEPAPEWTFSRPLNPTYYIGIGFANKNTYPTDYSLIAKKNALSDMSSEITIKISGESFFQTIDRDNVYSDEFQSMIRSSFEEEIKDYDIVSSWENEDEYWIYTRISKAKHQSIKEERKQKILAQVYDKYTNAMEYKKENKLEDALDVLTSSLMDLKEYWAEDNTYLTPEGPKHLDNDIYNQIREICSSIKIAVNEESLELNYLNHFNSELSLIVNYEGNYLPGIPVNYKPSNLTYGRPKTVFTAENGTALIPIETHKQYKNSFHINLWVDLESMLKNGEYPELEELLIRSINQTKLSVPVKVQLPKVYFIPKLDDENKLVHTMKNELQKNNFIVVSEPDLADVEINIESSTKNGGTAQGFKVAMLDFSIAMQNHDNQTILYSDSFTNIKGLHINYAGAIGEAYNNGANKIRKEVVPRILEVML